MPTYPDPTPSWLKAENASVLDSTFTKVLRALAGLIGADDPASQVMATTTPLDMSHAARIARAKAMGFRTQMPLYHGTASDVRAFDLAKGAHTSGSPVGRMGVSMARSPAVAEEFADRAAGSGSGHNILPLVHRTSKPADIALRGDETNLQIAATLSDLWDKGYDAARLTNYTSPAGLKGQQIIIVKDPAQIRSRFAAFDPSKVNSRDLLASIIAALSTGGAGSQMGQDR